MFDNQPKSAVRAGHVARKRFGQNFLVDLGIVDKIIRQIKPTKSDVMVEIGPGLGALTNPLLQLLPALIVVELDRDLVVQLEQNAKLKVIAADVLTVDFCQLAKQQAARLRVIGNLPYNISSPILFHLLNYADCIVDQHFMLQQEVVQRMVAQPGTSSYGRLSVILQWRYSMEQLLSVPACSFKPAPKVTSAVVRMEPLPNYSRVNFTKFSQLVKLAFSQKRKLLRHSLGKWLEQNYPDISFDVQRRAEEVSVAEYIQLAEQIAALK